MVIQLLCRLIDWQAYLARRRLIYGCRPSCSRNGSGVNACSKLGGRSAEEWGWGAGVPLPSGKESGEREIFRFVISKWHILVNSAVLNLKFFLYPKAVITYTLKHTNAISEST